jgi:hypothetical protein
MMMMMMMIMDQPHLPRRALIHGLRLPTAAGRGQHHHLGRLGQNLHHLRGNLGRENKDPDLFSQSSTPARAVKTSTVCNPHASHEMISHHIPHTLITSILSSLLLSSASVVL